jgi:hypothetical protein
MCRSKRSQPRANDAPNAGVHEARLKLAKNVSLSHG